MAHYNRRKIITLLIVVVIFAVITSYILQPRGHIVNQTVDSNPGQGHETPLRSENPTSLPANNAEKPVQRVSNQGKTSLPAEVKPVNVAARPANVVVNQNIKTDQSARLISGSGNIVALPVNNVAQPVNVAPQQVIMAPKQADIGAKPIIADTFAQKMAGEQVNKVGQPVNMMAPSGQLAQPANVAVQTINAEAEQDLEPANRGNIVALPANAAVVSVAKPADMIKTDHGVKEANGKTHENVMDNHQGVMANLLHSNNSGRITTERNIPPRYRKLIEKFPWLFKQNFLSNFYTKKGQTSVEQYVSGNIVFVHNQKSGGTTLKFCMENIAKQYHFDQPFVICDASSGDYYEAMWNSPNRIFHKLYAGGHTFGNCDVMPTECSYITVLKDPYERLISSYEYCKARNEYHCRIKDANKVSLREWAIFQGSFFFRQLLYNPQYCTRHYNHVIDELRKGRGLSEQPDMIPCWYRNELMFESVMSRSDKHEILQYVLENLEDWFAVIGMNSDYATTLRLLEGAFQLPFAKCSTQAWNYHAYIAEGEVTGRNRTTIVRELKETLVSDPDVSEALHFDLQIYQKAKDIFERQKRNISP
ncbi:uncharacterized protein [Ptychodera flava]|uniref:uncharacterized protein n=1 Tax=Ptychodera flava TaxID=63121 RepID=UPI003969EB27